jgi:elongation factor Ts
MEFSAADVKKLRDKTAAPMMDCKRALQEAEGDFAKAEELLRERGKADMAKRAHRETNAGVAVLVSSEDGKSVGGAVLESETDFVARTDEFVADTQKIAKAFIDTEPGDDPSAAMSGGMTVGNIVEAVGAQFRENVRLTKTIRLTTKATLAIYIHHDKTKAAAIELDGTATTLAEAGHKLAIQCVAYPPRYIEKSEIPQELIDKEVEIETKRAIEEGKKEEIAKNIAIGRVNKEFVKSVVLLEQPFYADGNKSVAEYLAEQAKEGGGTISVKRFVYLAVGEG